MKHARHSRTIRTNIVVIVVSALLAGLTILQNGIADGITVQVLLTAAITSVVSGLNLYLRTLTTEPLRKGNG